MPSTGEQKPTWVDQNKEDALALRERLLKESEERLNALKHHVAEKEKANQLKNQDLIRREQKVEDELRFIEQERDALRKMRKAEEGKHHRRLSYMVPVLLISCILAGYVSFQHINQSEQQFADISNANQNIEKLARVLNIAEQKVLAQSKTISRYEQSLEAFELELGRIEEQIIMLYPLLNLTETPVELRPGFMSPTPDRNEAILELVWKLQEEISLTQDNSTDNSD